MNLQSLQYFRTIADCSSFSKASKVLFVSQPNLSRHILALESELGTKLFTRSKNRLTLTESGKFCYTESIKIIDTCETMKQSVQVRTEENTGLLRLGFYGNTNQASLGRILRKLSAGYPGINVEFFQETLAKLSVGLLNDELDLIVTLRGELEGVSGVEMHLIEEGYYCACVPAVHALAAKTSLRIKDLHDESIAMVSHEPGITTHFYDIILQSCLQGGLKASRIKLLHDYDIMHLVALSGQKITLDVSHSRFNNSEQIRYIRLEDMPTHPFDIVAAHREDTTKTEVQLFLDHLATPTTI